MTTLELLDGHAPSFSKTDRIVYEAIRKLPDSFANQSLTEISSRGNFSKAALTRFAQRLGFSGFVEFQYQLRQDLETQREGEPSNAEVYGGILQAVDVTIDRARLAALAKTVRTSDHVFLIGANLSRIPAEELHMALLYQEDVTPIIQPVDIAPRATDRDTVMVFSAITGAAHRDFLKGLPSEGEARPHTVLVTTNSKHPLRRLFDEVFLLPTAPLSSGSRAVLSDTFAFLMFNDELCGCLAEEN